LWTIALGLPAFIKMKYFLQKYRKTVFWKTALLILILGFLSGFSPVLHNHDLDEEHSDCASCTWTHSSICEPALESIDNHFLAYQNLYYDLAPTISSTFNLSNRCRAPPVFRS
jgi:hypothetical protein